MDNNIYKTRRESLKNHLPKNCALILPGADLQYRNSDSSYALRQESSFYYLSGFCEPSSLMVIINNGTEIHVIFISFFKTNPPIVCPEVIVNSLKV